MTIYKNFFDMAIIKFNLEEGRQDAFVRTLQKYLITLGYLNRNEPTGYFGPATTEAICNFQVDYGVVDSHNSERC
jgi:peptidoglycan hydrolase-like protein with peptidoglycan-binding domain